MTVNVLIITHTDVGQAMLQVVKTTFGEVPAHWHQLSVNYQQDRDKILEQLTGYIHKLPGDDGTLIIADVFGATPCNTALELTKIAKLRLISGVNLPMLFKLVTYASLPLDELADKALTGGREGIRLC